MAPSFEAVSRQQFRRFFQPSRIMICVLPDPGRESSNLITVSFNMSCSYRPPMIAIAVQDINRSYELIQAASEYVLSIPGESLAPEALKFGWDSSRDEDKLSSSGVALIASETIAVPGLRDAVANIEMVKRDSVKSGDHIIVTGEVRKFGVNKELRERNLLSVGPDTAGYRVLQHRGIHRIAVIAAPADALNSPDDAE